MESNWRIDTPRIINSIIATTFIGGSMLGRHLVLVGLLLSALSAQSQPRELIRSVDQGQARRLEEYNRVFLQEELYSAARHRIVAVNADLLLQGQAITVTLFPDEQPVTITPERSSRTDAYVNWLGRIQIDGAQERAETQFYATITMLWWDVNELGNAELSGSNRDKFSPAWKIDENNQPVLIPDGVVAGREVGPPPTTQEEIAEHKRLSSLDRRAFTSLSATLELPTGQTYVVTPLRNSPRYSVVYELDKDKVVPMPFEPGDQLTPEQHAKVQQYQEFRRSLPIENKAIRGDIQ